MKNEPGPKAWLDVAKGLAMFLVVVFHSFLFLDAEDISGLPGRLKALLESFPMPAFFLISGLFASRLGSWKFKDVWRRRLIPILWLYLIWSVVRFFFYLVVPGTNGDLGSLPATDPLALLLLPVWPSSSYWFLYALAWFTFGTWALSRLPIWLQITAATIVSTAVTSGLINTGNLGWNRIGALFVFFLIGALFSKQINARIASAGPWTLAVIAALYIVGLAASILIPAVRSFPFAVLAMQVLAVAGGFILCKYLARLHPVQSVLSTIGVWSLHIYLIHLFLISTFALVLGLLLPPVSGPVGMILILGLAVATTYLSIRISKITSKVRWLYAPPIRRKRKAPRTAPASE